MSVLRPAAASLQGSAAHPAFQGEALKRKVPPSRQVKAGTNEKRVSQRGDRGRQCRSIMASADVAGIGGTIQPKDKSISRHKVRGKL